MVAIGRLLQEIAFRGAVYAFREQFGERRAMILWGAEELPNRELRSGCGIARGRKKSIEHAFRNGRIIVHDGTALRLICGIAMIAREEESPSDGILLFLVQRVGGRIRRGFVVTGCCRTRCGLGGCGSCLLGERMDALVKRSETGIDLLELQEIGNDASPLMLDELRDATVFDGLGICSEYANTIRDGLTDLCEREVGSERRGWCGSG